MLPGKNYTPEDVFRIAREKIWWLLVPFAIVSAATAVGARLLPNVYQSDTLILVVPQGVSSAYVQTTVGTQIADRLQASAQKILSRAQLEALIQEFDLYARERESQFLDQIIPMMRSRINVVPIRGDAFRVSYSNSDPVKAQAVTKRLGTLFIDQSLTERQVKAQGTTQFFETMLEEARVRLVEQEERLADYRRLHNGELPEQQQSNMQALNGVELQIRTTLDSLDRDLDRRATLERQLTDLEGQAPMPGVVVAAPSSGGAAQTPMTTAAALAQARATLAGLQARGLKPDHPDIRIVERTILDLTAQAEAEALQAPLSSAGIVSLPPEEVARLKRITDTRTELAQLAQQIDAKQRDEGRLRTMVTEYRRRIDAAPTRGNEMLEMNRDYSTLNDQYLSLLRRKEDSRIAESLEEQQIGENFKMLDEASLPQQPISPNRPLISLAGMGGGFALGVLLIALFEYRDNSFRIDDEVTRLTGLPVLAVVPLMQSKADRRRLARQHWMMRIGLGATVAGCFAVTLLTFVR